MSTCLGHWEARIAPIAAHIIARNQKNPCRANIPHAMKPETDTWSNRRPHTNIHDQLGLQGSPQCCVKGAATASPRHIFLHGDTACETLRQRTIFVRTRRQEALVILRRRTGPNIPES